MYYQRNLVENHLANAEQTRTRVLETLKKNAGNFESPIEVSNDFLTDCAFELGMLIRTVKELQKDIARHELVCKED